MLDDKYAFSHEICRLRTEKGWTQQELADRTGVISKQGICGIETKGNIPMPPAFKCLADALDLKYSDLLELAIIQKQARLEFNMMLKYLRMGA